VQGHFSVSHGALQGPITTDDLGAMGALGGPSGPQPRAQQWGNRRCEVRRRTSYIHPYLGRGLTSRWPESSHKFSLERNIASQYIRCP
jgi:hypothetical protein